MAVFHTAKRPLILLLALAGVSLLPGATSAGSYTPPPGDFEPSWSPDGRTIAFVTRFAGRPGGSVAATVSASGSGQARLVPGDVDQVAVSPDWDRVAVTRFTGGGYRLSVARLGGSEERDLGLATFGTPLSWSPDAGRVAFASSDFSLAVISVDGTSHIQLGARGTDPAWSPDGTRIAFVGGSPENVDIQIVSSQGGNPALLAGGPGAQLEPKWSPDGNRIAFLTQDAVGAPFGLAVARADGADLRVYPGPQVSNPSGYSWMPDGEAIVFAQNASQGLFRLDLASGNARRLTALGGQPVPSPDGTRIAFAMGGECRDRTGIYVARADGKHVARLTNDCRVIGTERPDVLVGTPLADVLVGLGGDDRLRARTPGYVGETLLGGDGDDVLLGAYRGDILKGGRGDDRLLASRSGDWLYGGPGRDRIDAGGGRDAVYARDGRRDIIDCGTNLNRASERDEVWADRYDAVAKDCELVHRS